MRQKIERASGVCILLSPVRLVSVAVSAMSRFGPMLCSRTKKEGK